MPLRVCIIFIAMAKQGRGLLITNPFKRPNTVMIVIYFNYYIIITSVGKQEMIIFERYIKTKIKIQIKLELLTLH